MNTTIIGVAGGTASGKSTLVKKLQEAFEGESVITLCHDYYYKAHDDLSFEERTKLNYDHPGAFDTDMMIEDIMKLKKGRSVFRPVYSFVNHNRTDKTVKVEPAQVIIKLFSPVVYSSPLHRNSVPAKSKEYLLLQLPVRSAHWHIHRLPPQHRV